MAKRNIIHNTPSGFFALLASGVVYSTFGILIRKMSLSFDTFTQVFLRCVITAVIALIGLFIRRTRFIIPKVPWYVFLLFLVTPFFSIASLTAGIQMIKAANAIFFIYIGYVATTFFLSTVLYKERVTVNKYFALFCVALGAFFISYPFIVASIWGMVLAMLAGVLDGISSSTCRELEKYDRFVLLFYRYTIGSLLAFVTMLFIHEQLPQVILPVSVASVLVVGASLFIIDSLWLYGFARFDLSLGSMLTSIELVIIPFINAIFLREYPTSLEMIGGVFVFIAIIFVNLSIKKTKF